jgi:hypothetical protein
MLNKAEIGATIVLIPHNNPQAFKTRLERDIIPTIVAHPAWKFQIIIVDNSDKDKKASYDILSDYQLEYICMCPGTNIMYGPGMNLAIGLSKYPYLVYACSNHGRMYDPTWIDDLIEPLIAHPKVAMTGSFYASCNPADLGFPVHLPHIHIQGGLFAARAEALRAYPYTNDPRWIHWGSDIYQSYTLLNAGFLLHDVITVKSVWRQRVSSPQSWKYVHDYCE